MRKTTTKQVADGEKLSLCAFIHSNKLSSTVWDPPHNQKYASLILEEGLQLPYDIEKLTDTSTNNFVNIFASEANEIGLYVPESHRNSEKLPKFFFSSLYWMRGLRKGEYILPKNFNLVDLYTITANPYERFPAQKLLSYYKDNDLFSKFGRIGNYLVGKEYNNRKDFLNALVSMSLYRFGFFVIDSHTYPIKLTYIVLKKPIAGKDQILTKTMTLNDLFSLIRVSKNNVIFKNPIIGSFDSAMPFLRLIIQVYSSMSYFKDAEPWAPLLKFTSEYGKQLYNVLREERKDPFYLEVLRDSKTSEVLEIPDNYTSFEQVFDICLICQKKRSPDSFGLCGHGVCYICQSVCNSVKCLFCKEHFVYDGIDNNFIDSLKYKHNSIASNIKSRIEEIKTIKSKRHFYFDWGNKKVICYG